MELRTVQLGNEATIKTLANLLRDPNLDNGHCFRVAEELGTIGIGNEMAIKALIDLLRDPNLGNLCRSYVAKELGSSLSKITMSSAIRKLKNNVANEVYNAEPEVFGYSYEVLWQCAQTLSYREFQSAWY